MKHLAVILAMFLLMGCQTTDTLPPAEASTTKIEADEKLAKKSQTPKEKVEHQEKVPTVPKFGMPGSTVVKTNKPLMCGDPTTVLNASKSAGEEPFAMWKDAQYGYPVIMLYNKKKKTSTIIEYIPGNYACFLSVGEGVIVVGIDFSSKKSGISVERELTKPLESAINIVQFNDAN